MRLHSPTGRAACVASLLFAPPMAVDGQQRPIVANRVEVSSRAASLHLEFSGGDQLEIDFSDGVATANGALLGRYERGDAVDRAWRELLEAAVPLSAEALARTLARWRPDELPETDRAILADVDRLLERALAEATGDGAPSRDPAPAWERLQDRDEDRARALLGFMLRHGHVPGLGAAELDMESLVFAVGEDRVVPQGASVNGSVLVADGDLSVRGRIRGHAIVVDGTVRLEEGGRVDGDVRLVDAELEHRGGSLLGQVIHVPRGSDGRGAVEAGPLHDRREARRDDGDGGRGWGLASRIVDATKGVLEAALSFLFLACLALLSTRLAGDRVDAVAQVVGTNPARSAAVGFAGSFLVLPLYVLGVVVLAVTIVGIPVLLAWVPLYPVVVAAAGAVGYVAASGHVGRWVLKQEISKLERVDRHNPVHVKLVGIAALTAPFAVGAVVRAVPWVGWWLGGLVQVLGTLGCMAAVVVGLGAVIITRGGRRSGSEYAFADTLDADHWSSEIEDADLEDDSSRGSGS